MGLPLPVTGRASRRAEDFLGSDSVVPPACSGFLCQHLQVFHLPSHDEAELPEPPWLARLHPCHLKDTSQRYPLNLTKLGLGSQHLRISLPPLSHPSNPVISFSAAVIRAYETSPRSRRNLVAEGRSWIPTLSLHPQPCPARLTSQQERSTQATAICTSTSRHRECKCKPSSGAF